MNNSTWFGVVCGVILLFSTLLIFGFPIHAAWYLFPLEAINGIAFSFAFGLGLNKELSYVAAAMTLTAVFYIGYVVGYLIHHKLK